MKKKTSLVLVVLCAIIMTACSTSGSKSLRDEDKSSISQKFKAGITHKDEVVSILGAPTDTTFTNGGFEIIKYEYERMTPRARNFIPYNFFSLVHDGEKKELVILFNEESIIKRISMTESEFEHREGVAE